MGACSSNSNTCVIPSVGIGFKNFSPLSEKYDIGEVLGKGGYAIVRRITRKSDLKEFAVKIWKKSEMKNHIIADVQKEAQIMFYIDHPNCVRAHEILESEEHFFMVMDLLKGNDLYERIHKKKRVIECEAADYIYQLAIGLKYLHMMGVIHRDLKPENIMFEKPFDEVKIGKNKLKITDFGLSILRKTDEKVEGACGTPHYVAPEVLKGKPYNEQVDMWGLGVLLYIILSGYLPFHHDNQAIMFHMIMEGRYRMVHPIWNNISLEAKDLISKLLVADPNLRYTTDDVLNHAWIKKFIREMDEGVSRKELPSYDYIDSKFDSYEAHVYEDINQSEDVSSGVQRDRDVEQEKEYDKQTKQNGNFTDRETRSNSYLSATAA